MSRTTHDGLDQLRAANPARVVVDRGGGVIAQAALQRILADPVPPARKGNRWRRRSPRGLVVVLGVMVLGAGGALAGTDPFGWWSPNANEARYRADPYTRVATPSAQEITCRRDSSAEFRCAPGRSVQTYARIDAIQTPVGLKLSRDRLLAYIAGAMAARRMSATTAARIRADLARVPDGFFAKLELASSYGTYGGGEERNGRTMVPPAGVPMFLVCQNAAPALMCRDLNGDQNAPVGAGVYMANSAPGWRPATLTRQAQLGPPGVSFTPEEIRVLIDVSRGGSSSGAHSSSSVRAAPARVPARPAAAGSSRRAKPQP